MISSGKKTVIIINGKGGVGKDTLIEEFQKRSSYLACSVSSIDCIKELARLGGYWDEDKSEKGRNFLHMLKEAYVYYCDLPLNACLSEYSKFLMMPYDIIFVHIREIPEIEKFKNAIIMHRNVTTLYITRSGYESNGTTEADSDAVENYNYDYRFDNTIIDNNPDVVFDSFTKLINRIHERWINS